MNKNRDCCRIPSEFVKTEKGKTIRQFKLGVAPDVKTDNEIRSQTGDGYETDDSRKFDGFHNQNSAFPGNLGKGITSRMLVIPVTN